MSAQQDRIERSRLPAWEGSGKAFKITAIGGLAAPNATDAMTLEQVERWIRDHIKPKR
jgi:hypothetical protein